MHRRHTGFVSMAGLAIHPLIAIVLLDIDFQLWCCDHLQCLLDLVVGSFAQKSSIKLRTGFGIISIYKLQIRCWKNGSTYTNDQYDTSLDHQLALADLQLCG
ncbi:hypothetical protein K493DRAFT_393232 [Basidiobolus meristosporus CBS 931.73]|uniref:Uncharacterized protein n=1 Tax=Basidiobolus meristosporus CBS 931.73 TaxID=1314790 RepID=A0A1Y1YP73_9FUNG|nr:hypothetical protein K493DRAFT_393232 [Basidiobolus meristosporus CBS 931.73]|eukprot:ORX99633.1 hypothetical protein K493DRAFT_393232 [Basidiobolus meristosporus CBS 931.73]